MKKTLALLIAVLMVVAMLPLSILTAAAEEPVENFFAVYDTADELVGSYATLADADAALAEGYTLKLLKNYTATEPYAWGAARTDADPIWFVVDGNGFSITYEGEGAAWTFGANRADEGVMLVNVKIAAMNGVAIEISNGTECIVESGMYISVGRAVVRTVAGASASNPASLTITGGEFILGPADDVQASDAVITNGDAGNVYIYGGTFVNSNDTVNGATYSEYVLKHTNAAGDFKIYGGIMMGTGVQKGFYKPANTAATAGISLPATELPIIKGVTASYNYMGRDFYYSSYGAAEGDALLVPMLAPAARAEVVITEVEGSDPEVSVNLVFVTNVSNDLMAAMQTWARAKADAAGVDADSWEIDFGTLVTLEDVFVLAEGSFEKVLALQEEAGDQAQLCQISIISGSDDVVPTANGYELLTRVEGFDPEVKEVNFVAVPFIDLTIEGQGTERIYGEFNMTTGMNCMADVAANALRDNAAQIVGDYQYPSIMVEQAFSRYTEAQQQILLEYLAHEHVFNFRGECIADDCTEDVCETLEEETAAPFYTENGSEQFFELELEEGVRYVFGLLNDNASYELYDENGNACTVTNGIVAPAATGTYYLRVIGEKTASNAVLFSHIHDVDYLGECAVCAENVSAEATVGANNNWVAVKGNTYVLHVELEAGTVYAMRAMNGSFTLYNADGEAQTVTDNVFVCPEEGSGTYYIMVQANYTGTVTMQIAHIHQYDYTGLCAYCGDNLGVQLNGVYAYSESQRVKAGEKLYMSIRLEAGKTYSIVANGYVGSFTLYDEAGTEQTLSNGSTFACAADGIYYLKVNVQTDTNAQIRFEVDHGAECTYNNKGECTFTHANYEGTQVEVSCGKTNRTRIEDEATKTATILPGEKGHFVLDYASAGVTYHISLAGGLNYTFYKADGTALTGLSEIVAENFAIVTYTSAADATIYMVLENTGDTAVTASIAVAHEHIIDHRGQCTVKNTTTGKTPSACAERRTTTIYEGETVNVAYTENGVYRYTIPMMADVEYSIVFANAAVTWELKNTDGTTVYSSSSAESPYIPASTANRYLVVTATADSSENATLLVKGHTHSFNNKGECVGVDCDETFNKKILVAGVEYDGYMATGVHYFNVEMEEGNVYELTFTADGVTYKLYSGENADVEVTLTDGAFTCTETATYYYVVTVAEDIPANETYTVEVTAGA